MQTSIAVGGLPKLLVRALTIRAVSHRHFNSMLCTLSIPWQSPLSSRVQAAARLRVVRIAMPMAVGSRRGRRGVIAFLKETR